MLNLFKLLHYSPLPRLAVLAEQLSADAPDQSATDLLVELEKDMEQGHRLPLRRGLGLQRPIGKISAKFSSFSTVSDFSNRFFAKFWDRSGAEVCKS